MRISFKKNSKSRIYFLIAGCLSVIILATTLLLNYNKCIDKQLTTVDVMIVNEFYEPKKTYYHYSRARDRYVSETEWAQCEITVEYDGVWYSLQDENTYKKYHGKVGEIVKATLVTKKFEDGSVKEYIVKLGKSDGE